MSAATLDFTEQSDLEAAEQGSVFSFDVSGIDETITGATIRMQVRTSWDATGSPLIDASTTGGQISITGAHAFTVEVDAVTMAAVDAGTWVHDVEVVPGGVEADAFKLFRGAFQVLPEATR